MAWAILGGGTFLSFPGYLLCIQEEYMLLNVCVFLLLICLLLHGAEEGLSQGPRRVAGKFFFLPHHISPHMHSTLQDHMVGLCHPYSPAAKCHLGSGEPVFSRERDKRNKKESERKIFNSWKTFPEGLRSYAAPWNLFP